MQTPVQPKVSDAAEEPNELDIETQFASESQDGMTAEPGYNPVESVILNLRDDAYRLRHEPDFTREQIADDLDVLIGRLVNDLPSALGGPTIHVWKDGYDVGRRGGLNAPDLHPATSNLVMRFSDALRQKLAEAEVKYDYADGWTQTDWFDECRASLMEHIAKGDPRDVAAFCMFLWHHGESTTSGEASIAEQKPWRPMVTAPKDGTMIRLLVDYSAEDACNPLEDAKLAQTIGANTDKNTGDTQSWLIAGWSWEQDCFTQGQGRPIGWLPFTYPMTPAIEQQSP